MGTFSASPSVMFLAASTRRLVTVPRRSSKVFSGGGLVLQAAEQVVARVGVEVGESRS